ncbi:alpha/beta hydrolase-fold protein [Luteimonas composti]|uniref:Alpha/beta hydrolase-fold protein n=1 Tax=Luteimonas composti TaxID=398257 RepID=A0ABT6MNQ7_9GAMM|nr:alpha/beta hydrolase-fold protein [Luteimonas composti]MDH7452183.1 alpha/beta hydrolase-fold protein [Luteimonas composti]
MSLSARLLALVLLSWLPFAQAQDAPGRTPPGDRAMTPLDHLAALRGGYFPLVDAASGRTHHVYVRLPEGYEAEPGRRWPVVYLLDGDSLFPLLASTHLFLTYDEALPEAIVVGIAYGGFDPAINRRNLDFTAAGADTAADQGGAEAFHRFLRGQLLPEVEGRYRADPSRRVLVGQSRGGYFVLWSALQDPDLFWGRIASNPAAAPAREQLYRSPAPHRRGDLGVVVASGARDTAGRVAHAKEWASTWAARRDAPWQVQLSVLPDGTHAASIGEAYRRAMLWLFDEGRDGAAPRPAR